MNFQKLSDYFTFGIKQFHWFLILQWPEFFTFVYEKAILAGLEKEDGRDMLPKLIPYLVISSVSVFLSSCAFAVFFDAAKKGNRIKIGEIYQLVFSKFRSIFVASLVCGVAFCLGILAYVIPGLALMALYAFVPYVVVLEEPKTLMAGLNRSWRLTARIPFSVGFVVFLQLVLQFVLYLLGHNFPKTFVFYALEFVLLFGAGVFIHLWFTHLYFKYRN